ncbi:alpha/beta fold hydrolase [Cytobacillus purgationiresistens]|uniref:Pimeloyl-ACP methyl ester carboxylesterase n=1 Tax=Cytobacillus purgationiresistens TaxID=863449 RepID=A0ABU0AQJ2_9BACI|nr:alpha/beta hydrolase [Cytobacillus purgationiresistens]MDQ0273139.1 pimeloyl-ACP methyl ester carboxylesterase [Cytobacillus purgationiresistens]
MEFYQKNINGNQIQIADYPGTKGTIVAVHGLTGNHKQMHYYAESLKGEYRFIALDLRGRGNSSATDEDTSLYKHAEDVIALIKDLKIEDPILMGYSMGAFICAVVARKLKNVKGLILLDGAAACTDQQRNIVQPSLGRLSKEYGSEESYLTELETIYTRLGVKWTDHLCNVGQYEIHEVGGHWENKSNESSILADFNSFYSFVPKEEFANTECPILLVHASGNIGPMEPLFYAEAYDDTKSFAKNIEMVTSACNHYTMVFENRQEINDSIQSFLKKI